jgi:serine/threonine protein kinase
MASQQELVEQLFEAALALTPRERDTFLDKMCSGDPELKRIVEDLLAKDARAGSFLEHPPLDLLAKEVTAGTRLGQYEIVAPIGAGSMGEVFRARDLRVRREVAIKLLPRCYFSDPDRLRRFQKEAEAIAALNHPNILSLYDVGEREGAPYFVTELLEGETLCEKLRSGAFPATKAVKCAVQIAHGLAAAHEKGIVHRDLKPENLFVTKDGRIKILDFGIAKLTQRQADSDWSGPPETQGTVAGLVMGTPGYMSPEQVRGKTVDHRADIFAFGAILYEMLAGKRAFKKATVPETMTAILNEDPPGISQIVQAAPPGLSRVVHRCLEKDPEQRFQSASDLAFALEALSHSDVSSTAWSRGASLGAITNQLIERQFMLTERVCRKLDRATLDPRIIGDRLRYVDNQVGSDVLVFFLHGLGLDHGDFEPILKNLAYRGLSPTLYGCEPDRRRRISLSLADHVAILRSWLREISEQFQPEIIVMVGFSLGADMGFELLLGPADETAPRIDAFLSLECNLSLDTCFASRVLAGISPDRPEVSIADLKRLGDSAASLEDWLNMQDYLVKVLRKFQGDIGVLQRAATDIVRPFSEKPGFEVFARWFKGARERVATLRLVVSNDSSYQAALAQLKLQNLDNGILGEEFPEDMITVSGSQDHFGLMAAQDVLRQVDGIVAETRKRRNLSGGPG